MSSLDDKVRARAYEIAERAAFAGDPGEDWKQAEREIEASLEVGVPPSSSLTLQSDAVPPTFPVFPAIEPSRERRFHGAPASHSHSTGGLFTLAAVKSI